MKVTLGAIKAIKEHLGIDLLSTNADESREDTINEKFTEIAELAIKWEKPGVTDKEAKEAAQFVTVGDVVNGLRESFGAGD